MSELKPCPFCGGNAKLHSGIDIVPVIDENGAYVDADVNVYPSWVECTECGATGESFDNEEESDTENAIAAWNRRAQSDNARFANCHIWEPGDALDTISDKCEVLIKAADIKALMAQPDNAPLTLEELRGMGFEWVWIKRIGKHGELPKSVLKYVNGYGYVLAKHEEVKLCDICLRFEEYGKTWLAYRRKPEPEGGA